MPAFLLLEGALYLSFLALDLLSPGPLSTALKYAALLLCLLMALAGASRGGHKKTGRETFLFFLADGPDYFLSALVMRFSLMRAFLPVRSRR